MKIKIEDPELRKLIHNCDLAFYAKEKAHEALEEAQKALEEAQKALEIANTHYYDCCKEKRTYLEHNPR